jgi:hypothetical protein
MPAALTLRLAPIADWPRYDNLEDEHGTNSMIDSMG